MIPTSDAIAGPAIVDLAYLKTSSFGQDGFVLQAIDILLDQLPAQVQELNEAFELNNWPSVRLAAHKIKSAASLLGMEPVKQTLIAVESAAFKPDELDGIGRAVREVSAACALALEDLHAERYKYL